MNIITKMANKNILHLGTHFSRNILLHWLFFSRFNIPCTDVTQTLHGAEVLQHLRTCVTVQPFFSCRPFVPFPFLLPASVFFFQFLSYSFFLNFFPGGACNYKWMAVILFVLSLFFMVILAKAEHH